MPAPQWGTNHQLTIEQPGLRIRITQPFFKRRSAYMPWLDTWVTLTQAPATMGGVLGGTLPGADAPATPGPLTAGIVSSGTA